MNRKLLVIVLLSTGLVSGPAGATIFGIKSCGSNGVCNPGGSVQGGGSLPPANLFSFESGGTGFTDLGAITVGGTNVDADGLAMRSDGDLFGFQLTEQVTPSGPNLISNVVASRLISLGAGTAAATTVGSITLSDRDIRGAVFDASDNLWALDATANQVLRIDTATGGMVAGSAVGLTVYGVNLDLSTVSDIAIRSDGTVLLANSSDFYSLDLGTGALSSLFTDSGAGHSGLAFDDDLASVEMLFTFEVNGLDDLFSFDTSLASPTQTDVLLNIIPAFNAGRGDLASITLVDAQIPEPGTLALLSFGIAGIGMLRRKKRLQ